MKISKTRISEIENLSVEYEVLEWFREEEQDDHDRINTVLRACMESER